MELPERDVAIVAVHGIANQRPGQTVREVARLLCHGADGAPRYVQGEIHEGAGGHTHYFSNDAVALAVEIDRLVATPARFGQTTGPSV